MYIIFEGIDTCGKTTQIDLIAKDFRDVVISNRYIYALDYKLNSLF